jgi:hypothetical protein
VLAMFTILSGVVLVTMGKERRGAH